MTTAAVIAWAWRTPLGDDVDAVMARLLAGDRAGQANPVAGSRVRTLAPLASTPPRTRHDRYLRRMATAGLEAAIAVARAAGLGPDLRTGLYAAVGGLRAHWDDLLPAMQRQGDDGADAWARGLREIHPFWMLRHLSNNAHALLAADLGARGDGATYGGGNAGAQAIAGAAWALAAGAIDTAIVVAYDSLLEPELLVELAERGDATAAAPAEVVAPYAARAAGFVPGEAAAALLLVRPDDPRAGDRRATIAARASAGAVACIDPAEVVDGAGRARPDLDAAERAAIAAVAPAAVVTCSAAAFGQLGAAAAPVQVIALASMLARGMVAPVAGLAAPAPGAVRVATRAEPTRARAGVALATAAPDLVAAVRVSVP